MLWPLGTYYPMFYLCFFICKRGTNNIAYLTELWWLNESMLVICLESLWHISGSVEGNVRSFHGEQTQTLSQPSGSKEVTVINAPGKKATAKCSPLLVVTASKASLESWHRGEVSDKLAFEVKFDITNYQITPILSFFKTGYYNYFAFFFFILY